MGSDLVTPLLVKRIVQVAPTLVTQTERAVEGTSLPVSERRWLDRNAPVGAVGSATGAVEAVEDAEVVVVASSPEPESPLGSDVVVADPAAPVVVADWAAVV